MVTAALTFSKERIMKNLSIVLTALFLAFPAWAEAGDQNDVKAAIDRLWANMATKTPDPSGDNPAGVWEPLPTAAFGTSSLQPREQPRRQVHHILITFNQSTLTCASWAPVKMLHMRCTISSALS